MQINILARENQDLEVDGPVLVEAIAMIRAHSASAGIFLSM